LIKHGNRISGKWFEYFLLRISISKQITSKKTMINSLCPVEYIKNAERET